MKAAVVHAAGQAPVFADFATPEAQPGEVRVQVIASALSQLTRARASGAHYSAAGSFPLVPGVDGTGLLDGRPVYFLLPRAPFGAMADYAVVPESHCIPLPAGLDPVTAAVIANPGMSSWAALTERARFAAGETVLINGATGASGRQPDRRDGTQSGAAGHARRGCDHSAGRR
jgi:NADPH:quinone reductase-like Zn-dependent oxidoreductase